MVRKKEIVKVGETKIEIEKIKRRETGTQKLYFRDIITTISYSLSQREKKREKEREGGEREKENNHLVLQYEDSISSHGSVMPHSERDW